MFTAPDNLAGTYFFSTHILNDDKTVLEIKLKKNDDNLCTCQEETTFSNNEDGTASCSVTVELNAGKEHS